MNRHQFLQGVHTTYRPRNYLEIGVNRGGSMRLSRVPSIGIDPAFRIVREIDCKLTLARTTSDEFFARPDPLRRLKLKPIDFAFIDGMHLFEYALRDFMNVEKHAAPTSVVVFDDMLPDSADTAARDRHTGIWAGDVFKLGLVLRRLRPDLVCVPLDTEPTGLLLVLGLDPTNRVLDEHYDDLVAELVVDDPQDVPDEITARTHAGDPEQVIGAPFWARLVELRTRAEGGAAVTPADVRALAAEDPVLARWAGDASVPPGSPPATTDDAKTRQRGWRRLTRR
jgi:hypothetical protein